MKSVKAEGYPSFAATASASRAYFDNRDIYGNAYNAQIQLRFPLFTGFSHQYDVQQAKADEDAAMARLKGLEQLVALEVWSSYYGLKTAEQQVATSEELLKSASESQEVALGRYKAGVGTILDLLSAQSSLAVARAQRILAYSDWFVALAQLAHDAGTLSPTDDQLKMATPVTVEKERKP